MRSRYLFARLAAAVLLLLPLAAGAQSRKAVLSGYVKDASSGEPLTGAVIFTEDRSIGVVADRVGYYSLNVSPGEVTLLCSFTGYNRDGQRPHQTRLPA